MNLRVISSYTPSPYVLASTKYESGIAVGMYLLEPTLNNERWDL